MHKFAKRKKIKRLIRLLKTCIFLRKIFWNLWQFFTLKTYVPLGHLCYNFFAFLLYAYFFKVTVLTIYAFSLIGFIILIITHP